MIALKILVSGEPNVRFGRTFAELFGRTVRFGSVRHISKESSVRPNSDPKVRPNRTEPNFWFLIKISANSSIFFPKISSFCKKIYFSWNSCMFIKFWALHKLEKSESIKRGISRNFFLQISYCKSSVRFGFGSAELYFLRFGSPLTYFLFNFCKNT